jgi:hypothetical protein
LNEFITVSNLNSAGESRQSKRPGMQRNKKMILRQMRTVFPSRDAVAWMTTRRIRT